MSVVLVFQYPYCVEPGSESRSALVQRNGSEPKIYSFHIAEYCYTLNKGRSHVLSIHMHEHYL